MVDARPPNSVCPRIDSFFIYLKDYTWLIVACVHRKLEDRAAKG
jgi:hypothetical protein